MSRIQACFAQLKTENRAALIPYLTGGDPHPKYSLELMHTLVDAGADIIEIGVPFSDPMADGPTIQLACERALAAGTRLRDVLEIISQFRQSNTHTPVVLMGYLNPIEAMGGEKFALAAKQAGVDGVLAVDLAVEEADSLAPVLREQGLDPIFLVAPTSSDQRISMMSAEGRGYLYYVSLKGVTGSAQLDVSAVSQRVKQIKSLTNLPIAVGFGIRDAASAAAVGKTADAVIVGSALVEQIEKHQDAIVEAKAAISERLSAMATALKDTA